VYVEQFQPAQAIRFSMADYREQDWLVNVPLYNIEFIIKEN
jgi:ATPase